jgi:hypothetical protein
LTNMVMNHLYTGHGHAILVFRLGSHDGLAVC